MTRRMPFLLIVPLLVPCLIGCVESTNPTGPSGPSVPTFASFGGDTIPCGDPETVVLWAGQHHQAGSVTVSVVDGSLSVDIQTTGGWVLTETHLAVATALDSIPQTGSGNPKVGKFLFQTEHDPAVTSYTYCTDPLAYLYEAGNVFIAVHAKVELLDEAGNAVQEETAWADGLPFPGNNWATYFTYYVEECFGGEECALAVLNPNGGEELCIDFPSLITWDFTGEFPHYVRIELLRDGTECWAIADSAVNTGSFEWIVQSCDGHEDGYTIRITELGCGSIDESDGPFRIVVCGGGE
ncbi:MAG: hypothetical protein ABIH26_02960 [Candidatus Eisenbacteria bacterium]